MDKEKLLQLINEETTDADLIQNQFANMNAADIAEVLEECEADQATYTFRLLPGDLAGDVFSYISPDRQQLLVEELTDPEITDIMEELHADDMADFIDEVPDEVAQRVLESISVEKGTLVDRLLDYPEDSAGSVMTTEIVELTQDMTVKDALHTIRTSGVDKETIYTCYVVNSERKLIGAVTADALVQADLNMKIIDLTDTNILTAHTDDDREEVALQFSKYDLLAMPVVNRYGQLAGIVTVDDILRVIVEEDTEDFNIMGGISPSDEPYLKTGVFAHVRNRIVWLTLMMLTAVITATIIGTFEDTLSVIPVLYGFIPVLMGAGGNAGAQSATVVIRGMALGDIVIKDVARVVWRETRIALVCSLSLGLVNFIRIYFMHGRDYILALVITLSLCATLLIAKTIGCTLPLLARKMKVDPAVMSAPLITTIVDCTALIVYFSIAKLILGI
ncbi:MAG: magnesium transporter [Defluviitaleaceae bacterium]|nr:magnesium transporter [Defluviitaleaceae bacterium]